MRTREQISKKLMSRSSIFM
uniref:Uncharacterized protein n=1 Tax=Arundo donax TaxID=35708 RepID=A0A0A9DX36_ARUDO